MDTSTARRSGMGRFGVLVALIGLAIPASADARVLKSIWGPQRTPDGRSVFDTYRYLEVDVVQMELRWPDVVGPTPPYEPTNPDSAGYRWPAEVDEAVRLGREHGIGIALLVTGAPGWANGGREPARAPRPLDFARFLTAASRRYPTVRRWMIWGEPTREGNFAPLPPNSRRGPRTYARVLDAAYGALKRQDRRDIVVGGMSQTVGVVTPVRWLRWMRLRNGQRPRLDEWGHNPYASRFPKLSRAPMNGYPELRDISDVDTLLREVRRAYPARRPRLWLSEFGISSDRPNRAFAFAVSRRDQARWVTASYRVARRARGVSGLGWFELLDEPASVPGHLTMGLMTARGKPKPAYRAYRRVR